MRAIKGTIRRTPKIDSESVIEYHILRYLAIRGVFAWKNVTQGWFDKAKGVYRKHASTFAIRGPSDILGIFERQFLAIEVKSMTGICTIEQKDFLTRINSRGGIAFVARKLDDVINLLFNNLTIDEIRAKCIQNVESQRVRNGQQRLGAIE